MEYRRNCYRMYTLFSCAHCMQSDSDLRLWLGALRWGGGGSAATPSTLFAKTFFPFGIKWIYSRCFSIYSIAMFLDKNYDDRRCDRIHSYAEAINRKMIYLPAVPTT